MKIKYAAAAIMFIFTALTATAQENPNLEDIRMSLDSLASRNPAYSEPVDVSVTDFPVTELVRNIAIASGLNIDISFSPAKRITCNMKKVPVKDALFFFCKEKSLDAEFTGDIVTLTDYILPPLGPVMQVSADSTRTRVSFSFSGCRLADAARMLSDSTGNNLLVSSEIADGTVSAYGISMSFNEAVASLAAVNGLTSKKTGPHTWSIFKKDNGMVHEDIFSVNTIEADSTGLITARIPGGNIGTVIPRVLEKLGKNYFISDNIDFMADIDVSRVPLDTLLNTLLAGSPVTWKLESGVYMIGNRNGENRLADVSVFPMRFRAVDEIAGIIPEEIRQGVQIQAFPDLNSMVLCGETLAVGRVSDFLEAVDKSVPLVTIDVIIVDASKMTSRSIGLGLGVGTAPAVTSGTVGPGIDATLNAESINDILSSFNGFGALNLGHVTQNFFANLQFLEDAGKITLRSTPKLATLNGHKAVLKSGEVRYYKESQVNIIGTQNPMQSESYIWKEVEANFILDMTPFVSLDTTITLKINLSQDEFSENSSVKDKEDEYAPPGLTKRSFNSIVKVKNGETVLLGGIEKNLTDDSSRGLPFVARVPVLRHIFGNSRRTRNDQTLNVFIRPTIIM
ncbi:MAG: type II secretion system protein GspD [Bacteroidetes bacterium]|uniref:Type II secretion system protein GspD n=1 Tax=Candidatus Cryptobacteroides faecipullorum TaxID=2840764 RepID=A0A9D9I7Z3_9BACT|nr:type II secretion system protein GspD [Candidatus Cryptobacteroides faecipullorum]